jgi:hypothetical protein
MEMDGRAKVATNSVQQQRFDRNRHKPLDTLPI